MKKKKNFLHTMMMLFLCVLFAWLQIPQEAYALNTIDTKKPVSVSVTYAVGNQRISNVEFALYHVANVFEDESMQLTEQFQNYSIDLRDLNEENATAEAEILAAYVKRDKLLPSMQAKTDLNGYLKLSEEGKDFYAGVYLIIGADHVIDGKMYDTLPVLIAMPIYTGDNGFEYDVMITPKYREKEKTTEITVVKIWQDEENDRRPSKIEAQLIKGEDDTVVDTVVLDKSNGWRHTWTNLPFADWEVIEKEVPENYTVTIERDGDIVILTNTSTKKPPEDPEKPPEDPPKDPEEPPKDPEDPPKDPEDPPKDPEDPEESTESKEPETQEQPTEQKQPVKKLPQTGMCWWPVPILAILGVVCVAAGLIRRRYEE